MAGCKFMRSDETSSQSRRCVRTAVACLMLLSTSALTQAPAAPPRVNSRQAQTPERLELGKMIEREAAGAEGRTYIIACASGQFLHVVVVQKGVDIVVTPRAPGGQRVMEVDSPNGKDGPEPVFHVTEAAGDYALEVRAIDPNAARSGYTVTLEELRAATPNADK